MKYMVCIVNGQGAYLEYEFETMEEAVSFYDRKRQHEDLITMREIKE